VECYQTSVFYKAKYEHSLIDFVFKLSHSATH